MCDCPLPKEVILNREMSESSILLKFSIFVPDSILIYHFLPCDSGFLLEKNLRGGGGGKTINHCFLKTIGCCFYCSFYCFLKILGASAF